MDGELTGFTCRISRNQLSNNGKMLGFIVRLIPLPSNFRVVVMWSLSWGMETCMRTGNPVFICRQFKWNRFAEWLELMCS